ncbi:MAG TPA: hypothetical protein VNP53_05045 [Methylomirabilota bacterium]|nr:hypothetical protein [Methylomirabilota bacterium]
MTARKKNPAAVALGRLGGRAGGAKGGRSRMAELTHEERAQLGRRGARRRWADVPPKERSAMMRAVRQGKKTGG